MQSSEPTALDSSAIQITSLVSGGGKPLLVTPGSAKTLRNCADSAAVREQIVGSLCTAGAVLLRGFGPRNPLELRDFAASFGEPLKSYDFGSTPRRRVAGQVYTSTEYPSHQSIPLHNEQSYASERPSHLWFMCQKPASEGGETPLADSRRVYEDLPRSLRDEFMQRDLLYVRNYGEHFDLPWQSVFGCEERGAVERYCAAHDIEWHWKPNGDLRTRQRRPAAVEHPRTGAWVWFNQAHLFHISNVSEPARSSLLATFGEEDLPRNVYFGDGGRISDGALDEIRAVYRRHTTSFRWEAGDVLMLDNLLWAHGRNPFVGERRVVVVMA